MCCPKKKELAKVNTTVKYNNATTNIVSKTCFEVEIQKFECQEDWNQAHSIFVHVEKPERFRTTAIAVTV